ncbi:MAG: site-specific integrase [Phycisphaerales bacterium]|nr:MAG: site-specific integrase [Phycisphaerales bacterium]
MAIERVGIYRSYYGPIPKDRLGKPLPRSKWPAKRTHSWVVRWHGSNGERYSRSRRTRKEAERVAGSIQADVHEGKADKPEKMTLQEFADMYMSIRTGLTERTRAEHDRTLRFPCDRLGADCLIQKITPVDARRFLSWYGSRKVKGKRIVAATVNKTLRECRRIFREAVDCQLIRLSPFEGMRQERVGETPWHHVTPEEFQRLLKAASTVRWMGIIALAYCCRLRLGEILNLTWADIDFEEGEVRVVAKHGQEHTRDWVPKDKDARVVPVPRLVMNVLTELQLGAAEGQVYVLVIGKGPNMGQPMLRNNVWRDFGVVRRRAGVPPCSLHDLRRSFCTNLSGAVPMHIVQELAGHSDIRTTRRFYLKVEPKLMEAARQALEVTLEAENGSD